MKNKYRPKRLDNISYVFVPFYFPSQVPIKNLLVDSESWIEQQKSYKYFLKYIADKLTKNTASYCVQEYILTKSKRETLGIINSNNSCYMNAKKSNESGHPFSFKIMDISLYSFDTNIGILTYKILHPVQDSSARIATKCYHLKKVHTAKLYVTVTENQSLVGKKNIYSISDLSEYILDCIGIQESQLFFNYTAIEERRCNILTHYGMKLNNPLEQKDLLEVKRILFYLRRNYYSKWTYDAEMDNGKENYSPSQYIHWGITTEGTACVTIIDPKVNFVTNSFHKNFHSYYLMMYILCLHQKLALYLYLSKFSDDLHRNPETTSEYIKNLAEFRAKYVFGIISESETYQNVYSKTREAFGLDALFTDIDEQVRRITEIQNVVIEQKKEKLEKRNAIAIGFLGFFCIFSTLVDIQDLFEKFEWLLGKTGVFIAKQVGSISILLIGLILIITFFSSFKEVRKSPKKKKRKSK